MSRAVKRARLSATVQYGGTPTRVMRVLAKLEVVPDSKGLGVRVALADGGWRVTGGAGIA